MALKVYNKGGGKHSEAALSALISQMFDGEVAKGLNVVPTGSAGLAVTVKAGTGQIRISSLYSTMIQIDSDVVTDTVSAPTSQPTRNLVVAYLDPNFTPSLTNIDNIGYLKVKVVSGAEAATPQLPSDTTVTAACGTQNWIKLGDFRTAPLQASVSQSDITDQRKMTAVGSQNIDWTTYPKATSVAYGTSSGTSFQGLNATSFTVLQTQTMEGLVPGWTYLAIVGFTLMYVNNTTGTILSSIQNLPMVQGRFRGGPGQSSPSGSFIVPVTSASLPLPLEYRVTSANGTIEGATVNMIPLYPTPKS